MTWSRQLLRAAIGAIVLALSAGLSPAQVPAFPGAEGEGAYTSGGRGGAIYHVTNLDDDGPGSFREGCRRSNTTIVFDVGGTIPLTRSIQCKATDLTIAGQTAPGQGVTIIGDTLAIRGNNTILRHMHLRPGDVNCSTVPDEGFDGCALMIYDPSDVVIDHCSTSWATDEVLSIAGPSYYDNVTIQWCAVTESLHDSYHYEGGTQQPHGMGSLFKGHNGGIFSAHHNLYAHHMGRSPYIAAYEGDPQTAADFRNNVIYDWGGLAGYSGGDTLINYVGNYLKHGPTTPAWRLTKAFDTSQGEAAAFSDSKMYMAGNYMEGLGVPADQWEMVNIWGPTTKLAAPAEGFAPVTTTDAATAYEQVLAKVGAFWWDRDVVDTRVIAQVANGTGSCIDSQDDVGGYPTLTETHRPAGWDSDGDGIPGFWEAAHGVSDSDVYDPWSDPDADGYSVLEDYLNYIADPQPGDANRDGFVDVGDLGILAANWGRGSCRWIEGDFTFDGLIDVGDLGVLAFGWGWRLYEAPASPAPEPTTAVLMALGILAARPRRAAIGPPVRR